MKRNVKIFCAALALVLVFGVVVGGTIAWLTAETETITNTFTVGNIDLLLEESDNLDLKMVPGSEIDKDPVITVEAGSEACWLFVKIDEQAYTATVDPGNANNLIWTETNNGTDSYISYNVSTNDGAYEWAELEEGVYYIQVNASDVDQEFQVLEENKVTVLGSVDKNMMDNLAHTSNSTNTYSPKLSFTAYACQKEGFNTAALAWAEVSNP